MKTLSLRVPDSLDKKLQRDAKRRGTSKSALVKGVLEDYYGRTNGNKKVADGKQKKLAQILKEYAGCLEGPGDLSYNPKHMEGFGR